VRVMQRQTKPSYTARILGLHSPHRRGAGGPLLRGDSGLAGSVLPAPPPHTLPLWAPPSALPSSLSGGSVRKKTAPCRATAPMGTSAADAAATPSASARLAALPRDSVLLGGRAVDVAEELAGLVALNRFAERGSVGGSSRADARLLLAAARDRATAPGVSAAAAAASAATPATSAAASRVGASPRAAPRPAGREVDRRGVGGDVAADESRSVAGGGGATIAATAVGGERTEAGGTDGAVAGTRSAAVSGRAETRTLRAVAAAPGGGEAAGVRVVAGGEVAGT